VTPHHRGTVAAIAVIAIGLAGTIIDPNGVVGVVLFGAAATAVLYLIARPLARLAGGFSPARVRPLVEWRTVGIIAIASGALLGATNLFDENGDAALDRILNDLTFLGGFALVAALALLTLGSAVRWILSGSKA
jgi:hypothetical protein